MLVPFSFLGVCTVYVFHDEPCRHSKLSISYLYFSLVFGASSLNPLHLLCSWLPPSTILGLVMVMVLLLPAAAPYFCIISSPPPPPHPIHCPTPTPTPLQQLALPSSLYNFVNSMFNKKAKSFSVILHYDVLLILLLVWPFSYSILILNTVKNVICICHTNFLPSTSEVCG